MISLDYNSDSDSCVTNTNRLIQNSSKTFMFGMNKCVRLSFVQCYSVDKYCNKFDDCIQGGDEVDCITSRRTEGDTKTVNVLQLAKVERNRFITIDFYLEDVNAMLMCPYTAVDRRNVDACPETHFWCHKGMFCLPAFLRCNQVGKQMF